MGFSPRLSETTRCVLLPTNTWYQLIYTVGRLLISSLSRFCQSPLSSHSSNPSRSTKILLLYIIDHDNLFHKCSTKHTTARLLDLLYRSRSQVLLEIAMQLAGSSTVCKSLSSWKAVQHTCLDRHEEWSKSQGVQHSCQL